MEPVRRSHSGRAAFLAALTPLLLVGSLALWAPDQAGAAPAGSWVPTANGMSEDRYLAAAVRLPDGRVLLAGGQWLLSADRFDPTTKTVPRTTDLPTYPRNSPECPP